MRNPFSKKPKANYGGYDDYDRDFYRGDDEEDGVIDDYENEELPPAGGTGSAPAGGRKSGGSANSGNMVKLAKPRDYQDVSTIADHLVDGYTVVMNIEALDRPTTIRMIDYLLGALYVLGGEMRRVTSTTLVLSPRSGEVVGEDDNLDDDI